MKGKKGNKDAKHKKKHVARGKHGHGAGHHGDNRRHHGDGRQSERAMSDEPRHKHGQGGKRGKRG